MGRDFLYMDQGTEDYLKQIADDIHQMVSPKRPIEEWYEGNWYIKRVGKYLEFHRKVTLSGSAENIDLNLSQPVKGNRIEYFSNDATAKTFSLQIFSGVTDTAAYAQLVSLTNDTNLSNIVQMGEEYKFGIGPIRIRTAVTASTAGKTLTIKVQVDEL